MLPFSELVFLLLPLAFTLAQRGSSRKKWGSGPETTWHIESVLPWTHKTFGKICTWTSSFAVNAGTDRFDLQLVKYLNLWRYLKGRKLLYQPSWDTKLKGYMDTLSVLYCAEATFILEHRERERFAPNAQNIWKGFHSNELIQRDGCGRTCRFHLQLVKYSCLWWCLKDMKWLYQPSWDTESICK